jgi:hypothetical protein
LQFEAPTTWQIWEDMGMKWDSTLSYDDEPGFRTGCCYSYSVFNFLTRQKLNLREKSLIVMDAALVLRKRGLGKKELQEYVIRLVNQVKKHQGEFVFLWHNSCFNVPEWEPYQEIYSSVLGYLKESA